MAGDGPTGGVKDATNAEIYNLLSSVKETQARQDERGKARDERFDRLEMAVNGMRDQLSEMTGQSRVTREQVSKLEDGHTDHEGRLRASEGRMDEINGLVEQVRELKDALAEESRVREKALENEAVARALMVNDIKTNRDQAQENRIELVKYGAIAAAVLGLAEIISIVGPLLGWF